jgi:hypothetical protein
MPSTLSDNQEALLDIPAAAPAPKSTFQRYVNGKTIKYSIQATSMISGLGAMILYVDPSKACATKPSCGLWLSNLTTSTTASTGLFIACGGGGFSTSVVVQGREAFNAAYDLVNSKKTVIGKLATLGGLTFFTFTQLGQVTIACIALQQSFGATALIVSSNVASALYGTVLTIKNDIPNNYFKARRFIRNKQLQNKKVLTEKETEEKKYLEYYDAKFKEFNHLIEANWKAIVRTSSTIDVTEEDIANPLKFIFKPKAIYKAPNFLDQAAHKTAVVLGASLAVTFSTPFLLGTRYTLQHEPFNLSFMPLVDAITVSTGLSVLYANIRYTSKAFYLIEMLKDVLQNNPVDSLALHLRPKLSTAIGISCAAIASLSYAVGNSFAEKYYLGPEREAVVLATMIGISVFHMQSYWELYPMIMSMLSRDKKERFLFQTERLVENLKTYKQQFIESMEKPDGEFAKTVDMKTFTEAQAEITEVEEEEIEEQKYPESISFISDDEDSDEEAEEVKSSSWLNCLSFFRSRRHTTAITTSLDFPEATPAILPPRIMG